MIKVDEITVMEIKLRKVKDYKRNLVKKSKKK